MCRPGFQHPAEHQHAGRREPFPRGRRLTHGRCRPWARSPRRARTRRCRRLRGHGRGPGCQSLRSRRKRARRFPRPRAALRERRCAGRAVPAPRGGRIAGDCRRGGRPDERRAAARLARGATPPRRISSSARRSSYPRAVITSRSSAEVADNVFTLAPLCVREEVDRNVPSILRAPGA